MALTGDQLNMSSDPKLLSNPNDLPSTASGATPKPSGATKKTKKSRTRPKQRETNDREPASSEKKNRPESKRSRDPPLKKDSVQPRDMHANLAEAGPAKPNLKAKPKQIPPASKGPKKVAKERSIVERFDAKFLSNPLLEYGTPSCNLAIHHLPPELDKSGFLLQASELSSMFSSHTQIFYQQGSQPAGLLDSTVHSMANLEFSSAHQASAVKSELERQIFVGPKSEAKYVCQVVKPIIGGVVDLAYGEEDDPAGAINSPIFKQFSRLRETGEPVNLLQIFATAMEKKVASSVQDSKNVSENKKEEKLNKRSKKKSEAKVLPDKKTPKLMKLTNRSAESESGDKTPESKQKKPRRRKNVPKKNPSAQSSKKASNPLGESLAS